MKEYSTEAIRNVALVSHSSAGKTMLSEAFLHFTAATTRLGKIEDGTTISDYDDEEKRRGISLYSSVIPVEYRDHKINLLDTPGYNEFIGEMISGLHITDCAMVIIDSVSGFEVGTEIAWQYCDKFKLPRFVLINKMDRENANFQKAMDSVSSYSTTRLIPVQLPWGEKHNFQGVIDLLTMKAYKGDGKTVVDIPDELKADADAAHMSLVEAAAEGEDALLEKYLETGELSTEEILKGLKIAVVSGSFIPVFVSAASAEIGIQPLLDAIIDLAPSPKDVPPHTAQGPAGDELLDQYDAGPLAAYVWKTTADPFVGKQTYFRVYSGVVKADSRVWNQAHAVEERVGSVYIPRGNENIGIKNVHSGDIGTVPKLSDTSTGNTICDRSHPLTMPIPEYPHALYQVAIFPKTQADSTKISPSLTRLCEEDMTLSWFNQPATLQTILQGMGDQHIDVAIRRAEAKFQVNLVTEIPKVP
ncbi:MAG: GTP-binding protein [Chloroflexi bacterium]|nr:GTP-binding protein [Chloroflexota bacterium]